MAHMSIEDREKIEELLKEKLNFTAIGKEIGYHRTTIANEIIKHKTKGKQNTYGTNFVYCEYENTCEKYYGIGCKKKCDKFKPKNCNILSNPPYVCNGCKNKNKCRLQKFFYRANEAQKEYERYLKESREGIQIPREDIKKINEIIAPLIKEKKQTVNQVYINHPDILYFSKTEFYRLINLGYIDIKNIDLPRKVKYKKRKDNDKRRTRKEALIRISRTYDDYNRYVENHKELHTVEMDTVERNKGGKVLLTLHFVEHEFMLMYILEKQTKECVSQKIRDIQQILGKDQFKKLFPIVLTDNGKEFYLPEVIEKIEDEIVSHVFYCDPSASYQKGSCEVNHHYISYIVPKDGNHTFDNLIQDDCNILMSHINSIPRECLKGKTPYESMLNIASKEQLKKLGVTSIDKDEVTLSPSLFKGKLLRK